MKAAKNRLARNIKILETLAKSKISERRKTIKSAQDDTIWTIIDCAHNVLKGNVPLSVKEKIRLQKYASFLRKLSRKGTGKKNFQNKRKLIVQNGGALPALLIPVLSIAAGLIGNLLSK